MSKHTASRATGLVLAVVLLTPVAGGAQGVEVRRPYRGLFGGDPNDRTASSFSVELMGAYDDNIYARQGNTPPPPLGAQESGFFTGLAATLMLQRAGEKVSAGVSGTSDVRYYDSDDFTAVAHRLNGFTRFQLSPRTSIGTRGGLAWAPLYTPILLMTPGGDVLSADGAQPASSVAGRWSGDYAIVERPSMSYLGGIDVSQALTSRASIGAGYITRYIDYVDEAQTQRFDTARASFAYRLTRYSTFRAGYGLNTYRLNNNGETEEYHDFTFGVDFSKPLAVSGRRTRFVVTPGFAFLNDNGTNRLHLTGSATLDHEIGRTWTARVLYNRGVRFVEGVDAELLANTLQGGVNGLLTRRLQLSVESHIVMSEEDDNAYEYRAIASSARLNYALSRRWSAYAQYIYYNYQLGEALIFPGAATNKTNRQGIRVGVTVWTPLFQ